MPPKVRDTIVKLLVFSFVIGVLLHFFDIDPANLLANLGETAEKIFELVAKFIEWAIRYILLGAVVVVPIWFVFFLIGKATGKGKSG